MFDKTNAAPAPAPCRTAHQYSFRPVVLLLVVALVAALVSCAGSHSGPVDPGAPEIDRVDAAAVRAAAAATLASPSHTYAVSLQLTGVDPVPDGLTVHGLGAIDRVARRLQSSFDLTEWARVHDDPALGEVLSAPFEQIVDGSTIYLRNASLAAGGVAAPGQWVRREVPGSRPVVLVSEADRAVAALIRVETVTSVGETAIGSASTRHYVGEVVTAAPGALDSFDLELGSEAIAPDEATASFEVWIDTSGLVERLVITHRVGGGTVEADFMFASHGDEVEIDLPIDAVDY